MNKLTDITSRDAFFTLANIDKESNRHREIVFNMNLDKLIEALIK